MKKLNSALVLKDLNAGLVVFLVALPLCLGIALASKTPLMSGVIAGIIGGILVGAASGSQLGVSGPAAGLVATVIAGLAAFGGSFEIFCLATLLAGGLQLFLGLVKAGALARYFPTSVIKGMLAAIGIIIVLKQIPHLVGLDADYEGDMNFNQADGHTTLSELGLLLDALTPGAILIGLAGIAIIILWGRPKIQQHRVLGLIPGPLLAVVLGISLQFLFEQIQSPLALAPEHLVQIKASRNPIEWVTLPDFTAIGNPQVWFYAVVICLIASVETLLCAEATDKIDPQMRTSNKNRELLAQGAGNVLSGLVGGLPITQVIVRSSANVQAGGQTRLATIIHGGLILGTVVLIPVLLNEIPMASLAAILTMVGYSLAQPVVFKKFYKKGWAQFIPFLVTIPAVLLTDLLMGVGIGIAVAIFFILRRSLRAPYSFQVRAQGDRKTVKLKLANIVSFINKGAIIKTLEMIPPNSNLVIDATEAKSVDPDVVQAIEDFAESAATRGIRYTLIGRLSPNLTTKNPVHDLQEAINAKIRERQVEIPSEMHQNYPPINPLINIDMEPYQQVFENNRKWVAEMTGTDPEYFQRMAVDQTPDFLYIGCSDSRVPANVIMGLPPGDVFVHCNVANMVVNTDTNVQTVLQYAIEVLEVKHIVVCGHYGCGGIKAALVPRDMGQLNGWLREIRNVYRLNKVHLDAMQDEESKHKLLVEFNVREQCLNVIKSAYLQRSYLQKGFPIVHGWVYDLRDGKIRDLNIDFLGLLDEVRELYDLRAELGD